MMGNRILVPLWSLSKQEPAHGLVVLKTGHINDRPGRLFLEDSGPGPGILMPFEATLRMVWGKHSDGWIDHNMGGWG